MNQLKKRENCDRQPFLDPLSAFRRVHPKFRLSCDPSTEIKTKNYYLALVEAFLRTLDSIFHHGLCYEVPVLKVSFLECL